MIPRKKKTKQKKTAQVYFQFLREKVSLIHTKKCRKLKKKTEKMHNFIFFSSAVLQSEITNNLNENQA